MNIKTSGIIIKRMNYGEADRILTILTKDYGKIKAIARGSRKILAKLGGSLEPFCLVDFIFHQGKSFYIVTSASVKSHFENIHSQIDKIAKVFYIGELIDRFLPEGEKHQDIFELTKKFLEYLDLPSSSGLTRRSRVYKKGSPRSLPRTATRGGNDNHKCDSNFSLSVFSAKILEALGHKPEVVVCLHCRKKLLPEQNFWDDVEGGVICQSCHNKFGHGSEIPNDAIKTLRILFSPNFSIGKNLNIEEKLKLVVGNILENYTESTIERELKSKKFLKDIIS
ncbi:MAG: DNA repair protein RecO (recombination protein O) [Candidatus Berkelbacteria bacterium Athens1014_28]|uniref:DNA repair protein RecO n=1 Tax=Candidatus Berkelbacteria bacterium Athens1014_28 TaxID=2017145 RepID=A0A554LM37_9BACT|nr:MAG: DNA repair protein RecO (recombination protein O) [Candidatus Berkelbacteria bacterium Athens1014_28]